MLKNDKLCDSYELVMQSFFILSVPLIISTTQPIYNSLGYKQFSYFSLILIIYTKFTALS